MLKIIWCFSLLTVLKNLSWLCESYPVASTEGTTHIVSYVHQRKMQNQQHGKGIKSNEFEEFDFENFRSNFSNKDSSEMRGALQQLFGRFVENFDTNLEQLEKLSKNLQEKEITSYTLSDDMNDNQINTLESGFGRNEQHESPNSKTISYRFKQSIPVLEPVRHLVNSLRDGHLNNTECNLTLLSDMQPMPENTTSMAIETEEEREMINDSNDLRVLDILGLIGGKIWGFLSNIRQVFAASAGSTSAALSSSSSSKSSQLPFENN